jgi:hypothetical protein
MRSLAQARAEASIRRHIRAGMLLVSALVLGLGGWASLADISGAVIAPGVLVVDSHVKKVQHPTGGIVGEHLTVRPRMGETRGADTSTPEKMVRPRAREEPISPSLACGTPVMTWISRTGPPSASSPQLKQQGRRVPSVCP